MNGPPDSRRAAPRQESGPQIGAEATLIMPLGGDDREPISLGEALVLLDDPRFRRCYELVWRIVEPEIERRVEERVAELLRVDRDLGWSPAHEELQRRRREFRGIDGKPARAQSPRQIRARAEHSWRRVERSIAEGRRTG